MSIKNPLTSHAGRIRRPEADRAKNLTMKAFFKRNQIVT